MALEIEVPSARLRRVFGEHPLDGLAGRRQGRNRHVVALGLEAARQRITDEQVLAGAP